MPAATPVAALPMYDWPEVRWATDALWSDVAARLRRAGIAAPDALDRERNPGDIWRDPGLVLSQTCAWPFVTRLHGTVQLVGTPVYDVPGCAGGLYSSFLVAAADAPGDSVAAFRGQRFAFNSRESLSGYVALRQAMRSEELPEDDVVWIETGGHRDSIRLVAAGDADLAAIDAVCWALAERHEPDAVARLRVVNRTPLRPGLPLVTAAATDRSVVASMRTAIAESIASPATLQARNALFLAGIEIMDESDYLALTTLEA